MNQEINKALTEAMGLCWHEWVEYRTEGYRRVKCKCGRDSSIGSRNALYLDFSKWKVFGILWEWAIKQEWWGLLMNKLLPAYNYGDNEDYPHLYLDFINPEKFANAIFQFLKGREND